MKTDDLKAQGLTEEQISFVMAENGKDIGKVKKDLENMLSAYFIDLFMMNILFITPQHRDSP